MLIYSMCTFTHAHTAGIAHLTYYQTSVTADCIHVHVHTYKYNVPVHHFMLVRFTCIWFILEIVMVKPREVCCQTVPSNQIDMGTGDVEQYNMY